MRAVVVLREEIEPKFEAKDIYLLILENGSSGMPLRRPVSERGERTSMARDKIRVIKRAEKLVENLEEFYNVFGLSIAFGHVEEELIHAVESFKPHILYSFTPVPITGDLLERDVVIIFPKRGFSFNRILYIHSSTKPRSLEWLERAQNVLVAAIIQPTMPPETSSKKTKETFERMERETLELAASLNAERVVMRGNVVEDTLRLAEEFKANTIAVNRGVGGENIEKILERADKNVIVV